MSVTITERDRLALRGGLEVIRIYQRMIADTTAIVARILEIEQDPTYTIAPYYGLLSDEITDDRTTPEAALRAIFVGYEVEVKPDDDTSEPAAKGLGDAAD